MDPFTVTDKLALRRILEIFSFLDDVRWSESSNYNLINYCDEDISADGKILTHWLCYIMDRQMQFLRVWEIGGYVISHLVREYESERDKPVRDIFCAHVVKEGNKRKLRAPPAGPDNPRLERFGITPDMPVRFASRYMPEDLALIFRTLLLLDIYNDRSFASFLASAVGDGTDLGMAIRRMALALDQLTYSVAGAVRGDKLSSRLDKEEEQAGAFKLNIGSDQKLFGRKRLWCSLRDYLKSPEFNPLFVESIRAAGVEFPEHWRRDNPELKKALVALELPGDVWNNSPVFRKGLFSPYLRSERDSWNMPRTVRAIFENISRDMGISFYPEQLDVTFDFVPRMCERHMCAVCPFGGGVEDMCHQDARYLCPVVLVSCGYRHRCVPEDCPIKKNNVRGHCRNAMLGANG